MLVQHIIGLAQWAPIRLNVNRERHLKWLEERGIPVEYEAVKKYLENLLSQGLIEEV